MLSRSLNRNKEFFLKAGTHRPPAEKVQLNFGMEETLDSFLNHKTLLFFFLLMPGFRRLWCSRPLDGDRPRLLRSRALFDIWGRSLSTQLTPGTEIGPWFYKAVTAVFLQYFKGALSSFKHKKKIYRIKHNIIWSNLIRKCISFYTEQDKALYKAKNMTSKQNKKS